MNSDNKVILSKVIHEVKKKGKASLRIGLILLIIAVIMEIYLIAFKKLNITNNWIFLGKMLLPGLFFLGIGVRQSFFKNEIDINETKLEMYGVEEPEKMWPCPKCKNKNPNLTFECTSCGYSLK